MQLDPKWLNFYNNIKDVSWPDIETREDLIGLPSEILKEILFHHDCLNQIHPVIKNIKDHKPEYVDNLEYFTHINSPSPNSIYYANHKIKVSYHDSLAGGGENVGQRYPGVISSLYPKKNFKNCFEWCSGPGFIGFDLLARNYCETLYLADIYLPAIQSIKLTIEENSDLCNNRVFYHHSGSIANLPNNWKFDLVVGNPPHWNPTRGQMITTTNSFLSNRLCADVDWQIHHDFFSNIKKFLNQDAVILLQENSMASGPSDFESMIEKNGLEISNCYWESNIHEFYYLEVKSKR